MHAVICSAVLHFANDEAHFNAMVDELWRVLARGGLLFTRLASNIGLEQVVGPAGRQVRLPDGTDRFSWTSRCSSGSRSRLGGRLADPIKTTNVQGKRCMTTWCLIRKSVHVAESIGIMDCACELQCARRRHHETWITSQRAPCCRATAGLLSSQGQSDRQRRPVHTAEDSVGRSAICRESGREQTWWACPSNGLSDSARASI